MLDRREICAAVLRERGPMLCVASLGAAAWDITAIGDGPRNLPLWGGMGGACMIALGLAATTLALSACATGKGVGKDIQSVGEAGQDAIDYAAHAPTT